MLTNSTEFPLHCCHLQVHLGIRLTTLLTGEKAKWCNGFCQTPFTTAVETLVTTTQRLSGRLQESTDRRYLPEEVRNHLHFGR